MRRSGEGCSAVADVYETTARAILTQGTLVLLAGKASEDFWILPGGHVEEGEHALEAVRRECWEEIGTALADLRKLTLLPSIWTRRGDVVHETMHLYAATVRRGPTGVLPSGPERQTLLRWASVDDVYAGRVALVPVAVWPWVVRVAGS